MNVKITRDGEFKAGSIVDLKDHIAEAWIKAGKAVAIVDRHYPINKRKKVKNG